MSAEKCRTTSRRSLLVIANIRNVSKLIEQLLLSRLTILLASSYRTFTHNLVIILTWYYSAVAAVFLSCRCLTRVLVNIDRFSARPWCDVSYLETYSLTVLFSKSCAVDTDAVDMLFLFCVCTDDITEANRLMTDLEPTTPQEYILKGVVNAVLGQEHGIVCHVFTYCRFTVYIDRLGLQHSKLVCLLALCD